MCMSAAAWINFKNGMTKSNSFGKEEIKEKPNVIPQRLNHQVMSITTSKKIVESKAVVHQQMLNSKPRYGIQAVLGDAPLPQLRSTRPQQRQRDSHEGEEDNPFEGDISSILEARGLKDGKNKGSRVLSGPLREKILEYGYSATKPMSFAGTEMTREMALKIPLTLKQRSDLRIAANRHEWYVEYEKFDFSNMNDKITMQAFDGLALSAWNTYSSHWRQMKKKGFDITINEVHRYVVTFKNQMSGFSVQSWLSAVRRYVITRYRYSPTEVEQSLGKFLSEGAIRASVEKSSRKPTGNLDNTQICDLITKTDMPRYMCDGLVVAQATGLRTMRVSGLRHKQVKLVLTPDGEDIACFLITVPRDKSGNIKKKDKCWEHHYTDPFWNEYLKLLWETATEEYENTADGQRDPNGAVFVEGWKGSAHNKDIGKYAEMLGWDPLLNWTTHSSKYGAAVEAGRRAQLQGRSAQEIADIIRATTGHLSYAMVKKYSEGREIKSQRAAARAWLGEWTKGVKDQTLPFEDFLQNGLHRRK